MLKLSFVCHGNADVERGFSLSGRVMTAERNSLSNKSLNSIIIVCDAIKNVYHNQVESIELNQEIYYLAKAADQKYEEYLHNKREEENIAKTKALERGRQKT